MDILCCSPDWKKDWLRIILFVKNPPVFSFRIKPDGWLHFNGLKYTLLSPKVDLIFFWIHISSLLVLKIRFPPPPLFKFSPSLLFLSSSTILSSLSLSLFSTGQIQFDTASIRQCCMNNPTWQWQGPITLRTFMKYASQCYWQQRGERRVALVCVVCWLYPHISTDACTDNDGGGGGRCKVYWSELSVSCALTSFRTSAARRW